MPTRAKQASESTAANGSGTSTPVGGGSRYASRTAFDHLAMDNDEDDDEEEDEDEEDEQEGDATEDLTKPTTRSAKKRQAKLAREAKKREAKAAKAIGTNATTAAASRDSEGIPQATAPPTQVPVTVASNKNTPRTSSAAATNGTNSHASPTNAAAAATDSPARNTRAAVAAAASLSPEPTSGAASASAAPTTMAQPVTAFSAAPMSRESSAISAANAAIGNNSSGSSNAPKQVKVAEAPKPPKTAEEKSAYWKKIYERTFWTFVMIFGFIAMLLMGHPYMILLVMVVQTVVYREVTGLFNLPGRPHVTGGSTGTNTPSIVGAKGSNQAGGSVQDLDEDYFEALRGRRRDELWSKTLSWYFFVTANYFLYGESMIYYFKHIVFVDAYFIPFARHHRFLSFMLYVFGFMAFILNLRRENLKKQFGLFAWVHMSLLLIVVSSHFLVNNILEGLIWFWVPASLVICNDIFAYVCGMLFGRTPLISLSPKKTMEGFLGAFVITVVFSVGWGSFFQQFNYMICPAVSLGMNAFKDIQCEPNAVFVWRRAPLPDSIAGALSDIWSSASGKAVRVDSLPYTQFQLHSIVMAAFASLVAPFGGFFASGFKRAFNIKDFGDSIPGHGGLTDRFDCQFLMGLWAYVYYSSLIREHHVTVGSVLQTVVTHLTLDDQIELYREVGRFLQGQGITL